MKKISILGSTGAIGVQALDVARLHNLEVVALAARSNVDLLAEQILQFKPQVACIFDVDKAEDLYKKVAHTGVEILTGMDGLCKAASLDSADLVLNGVVGTIGLLPTLSAINAQKDVALANKEALVAGGELVMNAVKCKGVKLYPVDSEHSAIFQCLQGSRREDLKKILLTASGGPFFGKTKEEMRGVTVAEALAHPTWKMGKKITVDSATLMNKGLEFIEAMRLFDVSAEEIEIVIHRESVIHSAVEFCDGAVMAQLGVPDMRIPIQYALTYPARLESPSKSLSLWDYGKLTFYKPDFEAFDCIKTALKAAQLGDTAPAIVSGADEEAVALFLEGRIDFLEIGELVKGALENIAPTPLNSANDVLSAVEAAREYVAKTFAKTH